MFDIFHTLFKYKEKESPDHLGAFPEKVHVEAFPERRYLWTSRLLVVLAALSICFNMMLVCAIYLMIPSINVVPQFFSINKNFNQIEMVQPREVRFPVSDLVTEQYIDVKANLTEFKKEGLQRYIQIEWIKPLSRGLWQAQFKTFDVTARNQNPSVSYWRATMRIAYVNLKFKQKDDAIYNPYGFIVSSYSLAYHGSEGDNESYIDTARRRATGQ